MEKSSTKLGGRVWLGIIIFGLSGQIAWIVENMYFNVFIDRTISPNPFAIQLMVALSAIFATLATLVGGIWSDRMGKRKQIMSYGYIIWGITVMAFALISVSNTANIFGFDIDIESSRNKAVIMTITIVILMDCIMSYIGSTANDAAFNAWVTDITDTTNRGRTEGVLAIMPLLAMAVVFGLLDGMTQNTYQYLDGTTGTAFMEGAVKIASGDWTTFYLLLGGITTAIGVLGLYLIKDSAKSMPNKDSRYSDMFYGFKKSVIKDNKSLYLTYICITITGIANMAYITYLIMYVEKTLGIANYIIPVALIIVTAGIASVLLGILMDKKGKSKFLLPMAGIYIIGAILMMLCSPLVFKTTTTPIWALCISGFILMSANLVISAALSSTARDYTPVDKVGLFQGVRMCFSVLIPMIVGPLLTAIITASSDPIGVNEYGQSIYKYPPTMFAIAGILMVINIPILLKLKKSIEQNQEINIVDFDEDNLY